MTASTTLSPAAPELVAPEPPRLPLFTLAPDAYKAMLRFGKASHELGLEASLEELIKIRASQLNGCAYCIDMHTKDARKLGEEEQRIYALSAWRETPFFTARERAALALTESITLVATSDVPSDVWDEAAAQFDQHELAAVLFAVTVINSWNRLAIASRMEVGRYEP